MCKRYFFILFVLKICTFRFANYTTMVSGYYSSLMIGKYRDYGLYLNGMIDEFRISNIARWTSNFTPPARPY